MRKFNIGDKAWIATTEWNKQQITCPDCCGKKTLTVIMGDGSQLVIDCVACAIAYEPPRGYIETHGNIVVVKEVTIDGVEERRDSCEYLYDYHGCSGHIAHNDTIFATKEEAEKRAAELVIERDQEEINRLKAKTKPSRDWAWNASYHRKEIKHCEEQLEYHKKKLHYAETHKRVEKASK